MSPRKDSHEVGDILIDCDCFIQIGLVYHSTAAPEVKGDVHCFWVSGTSSTHRSLGECSLTRVDFSQTHDGGNAASYES